MRLHWDADSEVVARSLADPEVFAEIFTRHSKAVFGFFARRVDRVDADDLASEVFLRAFRNRHTYDFDTPNCRPWLIGIARNVLAEYLRATRRTQQPLPRPDEDPDQEVQVLDRVMATGVSFELADVLARLAPGDRRAFELYALEGLTYAEVASALEIPPGTVATRIARVRQTILRAIPALDLRTDREQPTPRRQGSSEHA